MGVWREMPRKEGNGEVEREKEKEMEVKLLVVLERGTLERKGEAIGKRERKR